MKTKNQKLKNEKLKWKLYQLQSLKIKIIYTNYTRNPVGFVQILKSPIGDFFMDFGPALYARKSQNPGPIETCRYKNIYSIFFIS